MINKKFALLGAVAALVCIIACQPKVESGGMTLKKNVLMIGMEIGYPPMEYFDEDGKTPIGFDVEMGKAVAAKLGLTPEFIDTAWDGIFSSLDTDKFDCIMSSVTYTSERAGRYNFSTPYVVNAQYLVVRNDLQAKPKSLEDVQGLRLTFQGETTSDELYQDWSAKTGIRLETYPYDKVMNCFDDLSLNRVDVILVDSVVAAEYLSRPGNPFEISALVSDDEVLAICIKKGNDELTAAINKALDELYAEGALQRISQNIFGTDVVSPARK
ncbi:MAG: transporter substrate-binding domain-containing protein [Treponema sp.]|nr:transporter substrate-binding domain-containing protein [Treponema sp.]